MYNMWLHKCIIILSPSLFLFLVAQVLPPSVAGLFAGLSVSGQPPSNVPPNAAHSGAPTAVVPAVQRHTQQKGPGWTSAVEERQGMGPLGDLLGLSSSQLTPTITEVSVCTVCFSLGSLDQNCVFSCIYCPLQPALYVIFLLLTHRWVEKASRGRRESLR